MAFEFRLPDLGEGVAEGEVVQWFVKEGDIVKEDGPLVSVLTDKANVEIPSPKAGRVLRLSAQVGEKVKVGALLVTIEVAGASGLGPAPASPRGPPPTEGAAVPGPAVAATPIPARETRPEPILASPSLRRLAAERGIDLASVRGSGPGGRVTEADLAGTGETIPRPTSAPPPPASIPEPLKPVTSPVVNESDVLERVPIRGIRRTIAEHMSEATHKAAHFTYVEEVDVTELVRLRDKMAKHVERKEVKLSYLPFIVKSVVAGLRAQPRMNARMDDEKQELVVQRRYHVGIATAAPEGLIVPVLRDADRKSISQLALEIQDLAERGRAGKLQRSELINGTFTITSLGALGGLLATPILNYPEVGILGVHKIVRRPVYLADGAVGPAMMMNLSVSLDHRVLDGIVGAQFLSVVKSHLEDPHQLFADAA